MAQFTVADILGGIERGQEFSQNKALRPIQLDQAKQATQFNQLRNEQLRQTIDQRTSDQKSKDFVNSALTLQSLPDEQLLGALQKNRQEIVARGGDPADTDIGIQLAQDGNFEELRGGINNIVALGERQGIISAPKQQSFKAEELALKKQELELKQRQQDFKETPKQEHEAPTIPPVLLEGLSDELAAKGSAAFGAAGGGKDGFSAFQKVVDKGTEQERRASSPAIIKNSFPNANEAETVQLQAAMDSAKTTEAGLKSAGKVREEQRRIVKVQGFQDRSIKLLNSILGSDELNDVLGSIEGTIDFRLQDSEAELISDITEAQDILTADNLKLMSGVLSESDIKILRNLAGGGLKRTRTPERFRSDVTAIRDEMVSKRVSTVGESNTDADKIFAKYGI